MKRIYSICSIAAIVVAMLMCALPTRAQDEPEKYGVWIGGVQVTIENYLNITPEGGFPAVKSGRVTYSPRSRTLRLENAVIEATRMGDVGILFEGNADYNLVLAGEYPYNKISSKDSHGLRVKATNLTITGERTGCGATFMGSNDWTFVGGIFIDPWYSDSPGVKLVISGCEVRASSNGYGIKGGNWGEQGETLIVKDAKLMAQGPNGSVCYLERLQLEGCIITGPKSAVWNPDKHAICNPSGEYVNVPVTIAPYHANSIESPTGEALNGPGSEAIYTLSGVRQESDLDRLPKGVYICNGRKVVKK